MTCEYLDKYPTSYEEDEKLINDSKFMKLGSNSRNCILMRYGEKKVK